MSLKLSLKPGERMIIGGAVIKNGSKHAELFVENTVPLLREKDIMSERDAQTPCSRLYFVIQLMYIDSENLPKYHAMYWDLAKEIAEAAKSTIARIDQISEAVVAGKYYQALKHTRQLIDYEEELLRHARTEIH